MDIVMYSNGCPQCEILKKKLDDKKVKYIKTDNFEKIIQAGFRSVPVLEVDGKMLDFRKAVEFTNNILEGNE